MSVWAYTDQGTDTMHKSQDHREEIHKKLYEAHEANHDSAIDLVPKPERSTSEGIKIHNVYTYKSI